MLDASTSFGLGVIIGNEWWSWRFIRKWNTEGRNIGWAEAIALELAVDGVIAKGISGCTVMCHCNNLGVVYTWEVGRLRNASQNNALACIFAKAMAANIKINVVYVKSKDNLADDPSRGIAPAGFTKATDPIPIPASLKHILAQA